MIDKKFRFRQHRNEEKAHYASDCWDAELHTSYGWIEVVGHADRSCYDLDAHRKHNTTNSQLVVTESLIPPRVEHVMHCNPKYPSFGKHFKKDNQKLSNYLKSLTKDQELEEKKEFSISLDGRTFVCSSELVNFTEEDLEIHTETYTPSVIEPSFGIGRILYCLLEHSFLYMERKAKGGVEKVEPRPIFSFKPKIAPIKCSVLPLSKAKGDGRFTGYLKDRGFDGYCKDIQIDLVNMNISARVDDSATSLGRKYARSDELDFATDKDGTVTLRERNSCAQIRCDRYKVIELVRKLSYSYIEWNEDVYSHEDIYKHVIECEE